MTTKYREDEGAQNDINYSEELRPLKKISKKAKKKLIKSDNLVDLMDEDSDEIVKMMEASRLLREQHLKRQKFAQLNFETELKTIGDLSIIEDSFNRREAANASAVDHTINRLLQESGNDPQRSRASTLLSNSRDYHDNVDDISSIHDDAIDELEKSRVQVKLPLPSFDEKVQIREKMFELLEHIRYEEIVKESNALEFKEIDPAKYLLLTAELYRFQRTNYEKLKTMIDEYQPTHVNRTWGNDPDFIELGKRLRTALMADENRESRFRSSSSDARQQLAANVHVNRKKK